MSWHDKPTEGCDMCQVLYRDYGALLGCCSMRHQHRGGH